MAFDDREYLEHFGVKGMKWGVRKSLSTVGKAPGVKQIGKAGYDAGNRARKGIKNFKSEVERGKQIGKAENLAAVEARRAKKAPIKTMTPGTNTSSTTKKVMNDYNKMSDQEFKNKYQASKKKYSDRVKKYGDPYTNSPKAIKGKKLESSANSRYVRNGKKMATIGEQSYKKILAKGVGGVAASNIAGFGIAVVTGEAVAGAAIARVGALSSVIITGKDLVLKTTYNSYGYQNSAQNQAYERSKKV